MLQFFKYSLATVFGLILFCAFAFFLLIGIASVAGKKDATKVENNSVLILDFKGPVMERTLEDPFAKLKGETQVLGLKEILENIDKAANDDHIKGILLNLGSISAGSASKDEIRNALKAFQAKGKFIYSRADYYYNGNYYLASLADKIFLTPSGEMLFNGTAAEPMFYKGFLDKIGVEIQVIRHGRFKGAVEPFIKDKLSEENRLQIRQYKESLFNNLIRAVAADRKISEDEVRSIAYDMKIRSAEDAVNMHLVDQLAYTDQIYASIREKLGMKEDETIKFISYSKYKDAPGKTKEGDVNNKIAVIYAQGEIQDGDGDDEHIGGASLSETMRKARLDDKIKAIVFRINSPGGSALASDIIWREVKLTAEKKPVIVSMGDVAASGGYYIAAPATYIFAEPSTITGSIGVFGMYPNARKLLNEHLGITTDTVKLGRYSDLGNASRPFTEDEKIIMQQFIEKVYDDFISRVADGRKKPKADVDSIAQGRVWAANDALNLGLVDKIGSIDDAVKLAAEKAGLSSYRITRLPALKNPIEEMIKSLSGETRMKNALRSELGENYPLYEQLQSLKKKQGIRMELMWWSY